MEQLGTTYRSHGALPNRFTTRKNFFSPPVCTVALDAVVGAR